MLGCFDDFSQAIQLLAVAFIQVWRRLFYFILHMVEEFPKMYNYSFNLNTCVTLNQRIHLLSWGKKRKEKRVHCVILFMNSTPLLLERLCDLPLGGRTRSHGKQAGEMCQWLAELKHWIASLQVCPLGKYSHKEMLLTHKHTHTPFPNNCPNDTITIIRWVRIPSCPPCFLPYCPSVILFPFICCPFAADHTPNKYSAAETVFS